MKHKISFINKKTADLNRISELLELCAKENMFANRGPLYKMLAENYSAHFGLDGNRSVTPCANAGIALEAMAKLLSMHSGKKLKWAGSAFSFQNLGRGHFSDMTFVDCTSQGLLDLNAIRALPENTFDGIIVVNPFGLHENFDSYIKFSLETGKFLLIDNAAGVGAKLPDWPWQALSLHHTKPYGMGEGGLALTPSDVAEEFYSLLNYGAIPDDPKAWVNNGKISDISCAFLIERLEKVSEWEPLYLEQAERVHGVCISNDLKPLLPFPSTSPAMSWPYLSPNAVLPEQITRSEKITFAKYYKPVADFSQANYLYSHLLNVPTHPDLAILSDTELTHEISQVIEFATLDRNGKNTAEVRAQF